MRSLIESLESRTHLSLPGDANQDGRVDSLDFAIVALNYNQHPRTSAQGDFTGDARVNALDFNVLAGNFGAVEMATRQWQGLSGDQVTLSDAANYVGGVAPNNSTDIISIVQGTAQNYPTTLGTITTCGGLTIDDGNSDDYSFMSGLTVNGDASIAGTGGCSLAALSGNLAAATNIAAVSVTSFTGSAKTISCSSGVLNLGNKTIPASYILSVTGNGTIDDYTQSQSYTVGGSLTPGGTVTVSGALFAARLLTGFTPDFAQPVGGSDPIATSLVGSTLSFTLSSDIPVGSYPLQLTNAGGTQTINLDTITVTAAATGGADQSEIAARLLGILD